MRIIGVVFAAMALLIAVVPQFTNCSAQGRDIQLQDGPTMPMKCYWTAKAALVAAIPLLVAGAMLMFARSNETLRALSVLGSLLGIFSILLPTSLIGVCANNEMLCNMAMRPTLVFGGTVSAVAGLIGVFLAGKRRSEGLADMTVAR
jgi:hypothetical protein